MVSDAFFCVENFPARNTKIDVAHCASHDTGPCTSGFGILLPPCLIVCRRIELLVCPSVQLANIWRGGSSWNHRHVVHVGVKTHLHPAPCWRESLTIYLRSSLFGRRGGTTRWRFRRRLLRWPIFIGVQVCIPDCLVPVMMRPLNRNSLQLTVPLVRHI